MPNELRHQNPGGNENGMPCFHDMMWMYLCIVVVQLAFGGPSRK